MGTPLPALRQDLKIEQAGTDEMGAPGWLIYDPVRNRYFRVGWFEFEALRRFGKAPDVETLAAQITAETALFADEEDVAGLIGFLYQQKLLIDPRPSTWGQLILEARQRKKSLLQALVHGYLYFKIPICNPDAFLTRTIGFVRPFFSAKLIQWLIPLALLALYMIGQRLDSFLATFPYFFSTRGVVVYAVAIIFVKILHELSHAYAAKAHGLRVPSMGAAFIVMWPVLFTETSEAWRLKDRKKRLMIAGAGILTELSVAIAASFVWLMAGDGLIRSTAFVLASTSWVSTLLVNLNPFMRFDGYYLLGDALGVDNLQTRGFLLAKWRMRRFLFGFQDEKPETLPPEKETAVYFYAYGTWIYRFFLFLGIALLVYKTFFVPLGAILMGVEIVFFILRPLWREAKIWIARRHEIAPARRKKLLILSVMAVLIGGLPVGWPHQAPAMIRHAQYQTFYPPVAAKIVTLTAKDGLAAGKGQSLISLSAPEITQKLTAARLGLQSLKQQYEREAANSDYARRQAVLEQEIAQKETELSGLIMQQERLTILAPFDGRVFDVMPGIAPGRFVPADLPLFRLIAPGAYTVTAYVPEHLLPTLTLGARVLFYPQSGAAPFPADIKSIAQTRSVRLEEVALASFSGGSIAARQGDEGAALPEEPIYRVLLETPQQKTDTRSFAETGIVRFSAQPRSLIGRLLDYALPILRQEIAP
jgi:putative peptide zinc metalloprotease protein